MNTRFLKWFRVFTFCYLEAEALRNSDTARRLEINVGSLQPTYSRNTP